MFTLLLDDALKPATPLIAPLVSGQCMGSPASVRRPAAMRIHWTFDVRTAKFGRRPLLECRACSNVAKTRNPLKFAGVTQTRQRISAVSRPKFAILWGRVEEVSMFNKFFPIVDTCVSCEDTARQICAMVPKWRFLRPVSAESCVQHISDLHSKFALRPHHVWKYGRHPISGRRGKKIEEDRNHRAKIQWPALFHTKGGHNKLVSTNPAGPVFRLGPLRVHDARL